jgi:hypothetical protein
MKTLVIGFALLIVGCGSGPTAATFKGVLWLSWTLDGQPASDAACADVDHLVITVESTPSVGVAIAPVACTRGVNWERDDVPEGSDAVVIDAVDAMEHAVFEGVAKVGVSEARPAAPTAVDLQRL